MVISHILPEKNESLVEAYETCRSSADAKACCDYALHVGVTWWGPKVCQHCASLSPHDQYFQTHFFLWKSQTVSNEQPVIFLNSAVPLLGTSYNSQNAFRQPPKTRHV